MDESEEFSAIVADVYDAALDGNRWPGVLERVLPFLGGTFGNLFAQDEAVKAASVFYSHGIPTAAIESYNAIYINLNPMFPATLFFPVEQVIRMRDIIPHAEYRQTRFYKEWAKPLGYFDAMASVLDKSAVSCAVFAVGRGERDGLFDGWSVQRMQLLVPHVRRAVVVGNVMERHRIESASLAGTLDGIAAGLFLVDPDRRIVHANARGLVMLGERHVVRDANRGLMAADADADRALGDVVKAVADGDPLGSRGINLPIGQHDGERYVAHVLPLTSGARRKAGTAYSAVAAVFVRKAALDLPHPLESLAQAYKLTPAELRVLMAIVQIGGIPEVAPVLGISETTVRTHLQHVFDKTGTSRQADLVKIVAGYMSPLAAPQ